MKKPYPKSFSHIGVTVPDLEKAIDFYTNVMGWYLLMGPETIQEETETAIGQMCIDVFGTGWETGYRVLYRDALIAGLTSDMELGSGWKTEFTELLNRFDLDAKIDPERKQVVIYRQYRKNATQTETLTLDGYVIDDKTGERLPFTTVVWEDDNGNKSGTQTNRRGAFRIQAASVSELNLRVSHIGYMPYKIALSPNDISEIHELSRTYGTRIIRGS